MPHDTTTRATRQTETPGSVQRELRPPDPPASSTRLPRNENILHKLKGVRRSGSGWMACCPAHEDGRASLSLTERDGKVLLCCHAGCSTEAVLEAVGLKMGDLFLDSQAKRSIVKTYRYTDEQGNLLFEVVRFEPKAFAQRRPDGQAGWVWNLHGTRRVLYNLPGLLQAENVLVVEGEKDCETARMLGLVATCNPAGAGKWRDDYSTSLKSKDVIIVPDADQAGRKHAQQVASALVGVAASLKILELPHGKDLSEWVEAGGQKPELLALIEQAPAWVSPARGKAKSSTISSCFRVTDEGVFYSDPDAGNEPLRICSRLDVVAETRDANGEGWGRLLQWRDREGREHLWAMPMALLAGCGDEYRGRLLDGGVQMHPGKRARELLTVFVQTALCEERARCVSKLGWHGEAFVLPDVSIGSTPTGERLVYQSPFESEHSLNAAGSLETWRDQVGQLCSGNSRLLFAVSCAFAAPLLAFSKGESGGFHLYGPTSTGKTTALLVAGSVWGGGQRRGFVESWRTTVNGLEAFGEQHNDSLGCLDEISQLDAHEATECLYLLANGQGKQRMTKTLGSRRRLTWTTLLLSSGEITLGEHSQSIGKRAKTGVEIRLVNLGVDAGSGMGIFEALHGFENAEVLSRHLCERAKEVYGVPIRRFLEYLVKNRLGIETRVRTERDRFLERHLPHSCAGEVTRAAGRFALAAVGGELATEVGLTGWQAGEATTAAARCLSEWILLRGTIGSGEVEAAIRQVKAFLEAHGGARFQSVQARLTGFGEEIPERIINRAGFKRTDAAGETEYLILPEIFRTEVCKGFDARLVARVLGERGWLDSSADRNQVKVRVPELGSIWVYAVKASIMEK